MFIKLILTSSAQKKDFMATSNQAK